MDQNQLSKLESQFQNNPLFIRAQEMAKGKNSEEIKTIAENLCREQGVSLDFAWNNFLKQFNF